MFTFCDVLHERKQKTQTNSREFAVRTENQLYNRLLKSMNLNPIITV